MTKRRNYGHLFFLAISIVLFLFGIFYIADVFGNFLMTTSVFAGGCLVTGIAYLAFYTQIPASAATDWPIIQGLSDILLAIVLFMSLNTTQANMILYILSVWAATGAVSRFVCGLKIKSKARWQSFLNAAACMISALFMSVCTLFTALPYPLAAGVGLIIFSFGSVVRFKRGGGSVRKK